MKTVVSLDEPQITLVPGFRAAGVACGLKKGGELDLCLIVADTACTAAALFTTNRVQAAPVLYDKRLIRGSNRLRAVLINSGNANACTGQQGIQDVERSAELVGSSVSVPPDSVFVMSTGVIGQPLATDRVSAGVAAAASALSPEGGHDAARAIMTTDTRPKEAAVQVDIGGSLVTIAGICKGAGMIHPNMATMLAAVVTDVSIDQAALHDALTCVADQTFNMITVDGDMSTNDTLLAMASGQAGNTPITSTEMPEYRAFLQGLLAVATDLAQSIVRDGEGATKFVTVHITGAADTPSARQVAKCIANSTLVKTAVYGEDANWGRVLCAAGYSGVDILPERLSLWLENDSDSVHLVADGGPFDVDESRAAAILAGEELGWRLDLGMGSCQAKAWTCDLSPAYVDINAHYRT